MITRALLPLLLLGLSALPASAQERTVRAFGDSITVGFGDGSVTCSGQAGYPPRLRTDLINQGYDIEMHNHGLCGEETSEAVSRIDDVLALGGDIILIMEGTNDIARAVNRVTIRQNLELMVQKALDAGVIPVLASVIPRGPGVNQDPGNVITQALAVDLQNSASAAGVPFADPFFDFIGIPNLFQRFYANDLHPNSAGYGKLADSFLGPSITALDTVPTLCSQVPTGPCVASSTVLCLNQGRFRLETHWEFPNGQMGLGQAVPQTDDTGAFFWNNPENIEMIVKVLDGRHNNGFFWVFYGALSDVEYTLVVTDTETGQCREYLNSPG